jgi:hypothetical protein
MLHMDSADLLRAERQRLAKQLKEAREIVLEMKGQLADIQLQLSKAFDASSASAAALRGENCEKPGSGN